MATKVNTKFVIALTGSMVLLFGVVAAFGFQHYSKRAERRVARADALMASGEIEEAAKLYERAVGNDRTRVEWLEKWLTAIVQVVPEEVEYRKQYDFYRDALRRVAMLRPKDLEAQLDYLQETERFVHVSGASREMLEFLIRESEDRAKRIGDEGVEAAKLLRYRGLALVLQMERTTIDQRQRERALADLTSASEADATDWESRLGMVRWYLSEAGRAQRSGADRQSATDLEVGREVLEAFLNDFPMNAEGMLVKLAIERDQMLKNAAGREANRAARQEIVSMVGAMLDRVVEFPASELREVYVETMTGAVRSWVNRAQSQAILDVLDRTLAQMPGKASLMLTRGVLLQDIRDQEGAIAQFQAVVDMPVPPTSLEGLLMPTRKVAAIAQQVDSALILWADTAVADAQREEALANAMQFRDLLESEVNAGTRHLLLLRDAKLHLAQDSIDQAVRLLSDLSALPEGQTVEVKRLLTQALELQGNLGEALRLAQELAVNRPELLWAHVKIGDLQRRLGNFEAARTAYLACQRLDPDNEVYAQRIASATAVIGDGDIETSASEIIETILTLRRLRNEGRVSEARPIALTALEVHGPDRRLVRELIQIELREGHRDRAIDLAREACERNPNDDEMCQTVVLLEHEDPNDPTAAPIAIIDQQTELSELDKALERYWVYVRFGYDEKSEVELALAAKIDPDHKSVIDYKFLSALSKQDFATARQLMQRAAELDLDQVGGLLYQGRLQLVERNFIGAVQTFESAAEQLPFDPSLRRLLGQAYASVGRSADAIESYRRAYEGRPDNTSNAREYALALIRVNRGREALAVVSPETGALRYQSSDPQLLELWLNLEARYGNADRALVVRRNQRERRPNDSDNILAMVRLLMDDDQWDEASNLIDDLSQIESIDPFVSSLMRAEWHGLQGDVEVGHDVLQSFIDVLGADATVNHYLMMGEFLMRNNEEEQALAIYREAREHQNSDKMEADRRLGDHYFNSASNAQRAAIAAENAGDAEAQAMQLATKIEAFEIAIGHYQTVSESTSDIVVRKRAAETLLNLDRLDEVEAILQEMASIDANDKQLLGLQAALAEKRGNRRLARQRLDRAIELYPTDPNLFLQRAVFNRLEPNLVSDALQDLEQAVRLRPGLVEAWIERFKMLLDSGDEDGAFGVLRQGVNANTDNDQMVLFMLRELNRFNRFDELQAEALRIARDRQGDERWLVLVGSAMARFNRWTEASKLFGTLYDLRPTAETARAYLDSMLRPNVSAPRQRIADILDAFEPDAQDILGDTLLLARAYTAINELAQAKRKLDHALEQVGDSGAAGRFFNQQLLLAVSDQQSVLVFLDAANDEGLINNTFLKAARLYGKFRTARPNAIADILADALELEDELADADDVSKVESYRLIAQLSLVVAQYSQCAEYYKKAVALSPDDLQLNNDLAYMLMENLSDAQGAMPFAQRAAELAPTSSPVIDTLGWNFYQLGQFEDAKRELLKAVSLAQNPSSSIPAYIHLGLVQAALGETIEAKRSLREAERYSLVVPYGRQTALNFQVDLDALRKAVE